MAGPFSHPGAGVGPWLPGTMTTRVGHKVGVGVGLGFGVVRTGGVVVATVGATAGRVGGLGFVAVGLAGVDAVRDGEGIRVARDGLGLVALGVAGAATRAAEGGWSAETGSGAGGGVARGRR